MNEWVVYGDETSSEMEITDFDCRRRLQVAIPYLALRGHPNDSFEGMNYEDRVNNRPGVIQKILLPLLPLLSTQVTAVDFSSDAQVLLLSTKTRGRREQI